MKIKELMKLGLLESEAKVYLGLIKIGPTQSKNIIKETELNRVSVYKALDSLISKGLASFTIGANRKEFYPAPPSVLKNIITEKESELKEIKNEIPALNKMFALSKKSATTKIYEGIKGAKTIWEELLSASRKGDEWMILGAPESATILGGYFKDFNKKRVKSGVSMKIIYNADAKELINVRGKEKLTEIRTMPKNYVTPASIEVINDTTLIVIYESQIIVFAINHKETANSFRQYFNLLWRGANKI